MNNIQLSERLYLNKISTHNPDRLIKKIAKGLKLIFYKITVSDGYNGDGRFYDVDIDALSEHKQDFTKLLKTL